MRNVEPPAKSKMATRGPQDGQRNVERGLTLCYWAIRRTFDPSTPSMRKVHGGEKKKEKKE